MLVNIDFFAGTTNETCFKFSAIIVFQTFSCFYPKKALALSQPLTVEEVLVVCYHSKPERIMSVTQRRKLSKR